jgi:hypothetical protein
MLRTYIKRRSQRGVCMQREAALDGILKCGHSKEELQQQWEEQKQNQASVQIRMLYCFSVSLVCMRFIPSLDEPNRLKQQLQAVFEVNKLLERTNCAIEMAKSSLPQCKGPLGILLQTQIQSKLQMDTLYASLSIDSSFPELSGLPQAFVQKLILARNLKINIRKRCIAAFLEWDRLDQAVKGRSQALGTKLHQKTKPSIRNRQPALVNSIKKYNGYCQELSKIIKMKRLDVPIPLVLSENISALREDPNLMEDLWISRSSTHNPLWYSDQTVREGI